MYMKKSFLNVTTALALGVTLFASPVTLSNQQPTTATAKSYSSPKPNSWYGFKSVKLKKTIYVYKMKKGRSHAEDYVLKKVKVKKNSIVKLEGWCMSCGGTYYVKSSKFKWTKTTYYQTGYVDSNKKFWY